MILDDTLGSTQSANENSGGNWPPTRWKGEPPTSYKGWVWCNREAEGGWNMGGVPIEYFRYCQGGVGGGNRAKIPLQDLGGKYTFDLPAEMVGKTRGKNRPRAGTAGDSRPRGGAQAPNESTA